MTVTNNQNHNHNSSNHWPAAPPQNASNLRSGSSTSDQFKADNEEYLRRQQERQHESERLRKEREETQKKLDSLMKRNGSASNFSNASRSPSPPKNVPMQSAIPSYGRSAVQSLASGKPVVPSKPQVQTQ